MFRDFAREHPLIFLLFVCVVFGSCTAHRIFYREELPGAPRGELIVGGMLFSAIMIVIVWLPTWLYVSFA